MSSPPLASRLVHVATYILPQVNINAPILNLLTDEGEPKDDVDVSKDTALCERLAGDFALGKDLRVKTVRAMGEEQVSLPSSLLIVFISEPPYCRSCHIRRRRLSELVALAARRKNGRSSRTDLNRLYDRSEVKCRTSNVQVFDSLLKIRVLRLSSFSKKFPGL